MYRPLFTIPVFVATALLVLHSLLFRGRRKTLVFWGLGYLLAFGREFLYQNVFPTYRFTGANLKLLNVPLTVPAGWLFEAYTSLYLAQIILGTDLAMIAGGKSRITAKEYGKRVLPVIALSCAVTGTISCAIENVAVRMRWWQIHGGGHGISPGWIPGHMFTVFWLLTLLLYVSHEQLRLKRNLAYVALALGMTAVIELVNEIGRAAAQHAWVYPVTFVVVGAFFASLLMWRQLMLFFVVVVVCVTGDIPASVLSSLTSIGTTTLWLVFNMCVVLLYGAYLVKARQPASRVSPAELL